MEKCRACKKYHCPSCGATMDELTCVVCGAEWRGDENIDPIKITPEMHA